MHVSSIRKDQYVTIIVSACQLHMSRTHRYRHRHRHRRLTSGAGGGWYGAGERTSLRKPKRSCHRGWVGELTRCDGALASARKKKLGRPRNLSGRASARKKLGWVSQSERTDDPRSLADGGAVGRWVLNSYLVSGHHIEILYIERKRET